MHFEKCILPPTLQMTFQMDVKVIFANDEATIQKQTLPRATN